MGKDTEIPSAYAELVTDNQ